MTAISICEVCGNERQDDGVTCPFCGAAGAVYPVGNGPQYKTVNLEKGLPPVAQALSRLEQEIAVARMERCRVLVLIHGYGSSGRGGVIRNESRSLLGYMKDQGKLNDFLPGEEFSTRTGPGRQFLRRFPFLKQLHDLNRRNQGITLVVL